MTNVLLPMCGPNRFDSDDYQYPKPLIELQGRPLIEHVVECLRRGIPDGRFIFVVNEHDCRDFHLDSVLALISPPDSRVIALKNPTAGAACSALMAVNEIDNDDELVISNSDHLIDGDLAAVVGRFRAREVEAGTLCFDSVHPKWSFCRVEDECRIIETAEKRPLSRHAIAGFYYFRRGRDFVRAAMRMIEKQASVNGAYYIAPAINELVLEQRRCEIVRIASSSYHNFYSPHKIKEYEALCQDANRQLAVPV